ncbi:MAG: sigma-70 family RNA polymerase sigma factor [Deltaproteobacteria bacterium]|nr:sigma-70 family RNA polymerase sigma factor [Deltaproteobacteria bacterium]
MLNPSDSLNLGGLYRRHITMIRQRCRRIMGEHPMVEDIAQDVFLRYVETYGAGAPGGVAVPDEADMAGRLLYTMATNRAINALRDERRRREILDAERRDDAHAGAADLAIDVRRLLHALDPELAAVAVYYYVDGMEQDEIAEVTSLHRRTVSRRLEAFREGAKKLLAKEAR